MPLASVRLSLIAVICLLFSACDPTAKSANSAPPPPSVGVYVVEAQALPVTTELAGRTSAYRIAEVRPQVSGIVVERHFSEGGSVEAGQTLYQIDEAPYRAAADSAKATLARDTAAMKTAQLKVARYTELFEIKAVSEEAYEDAVAAFEQAQASVAVAEAALQVAKINLDYTRVRAPISGKIGRSSVTQGALVTTNQASALATIRQLDPIYVDVSQSSAALLRFKRALKDGELRRPQDVSASATLNLEDGSAYPYSGEMKFSEVTVDESTGTVTVRSVFPNPEQLLLPGMYVRATLHEGVLPDAILVPQQAVLHDPRGKASARVLRADNTVESRELNVVRAAGNHWLVDDGLSPGDRLVVDGLQSAAPGVEVTPVLLTLDLLPVQSLSITTSL